METSFPQPFGEYLLLERINMGGMAEVFKAKTFGVEGFERLVAIKRVLPQLAEDESFVTMLADEARIVVQLNNTNIVQVYELGAVESQYYIAMEYVAGLDLKRLVRHMVERQTTLPLPLVVFVGSSICNALDYAHHRLDPSGEPLGIVHRDISPHNVLIGFDGAVKVTDFGIAKAEHRRTQTQGDALKGKFAYMSPEQSQGHPLDHRSDLFATGSVLWEMLIGKAAFGDADAFKVLKRVKRGDVAPPSQLRSDVPEELNRIILKALATKPNERYQSAEALGSDLEQLSLTLEPRATTNAMAQFMREHFANELEHERQLLQGLADARPMPATSGTRRITTPSRVETTILATSSWRTQFAGATLTATPMTPAPPAMGGKNRIPLVLALLSLLVSTALVVVVLRLTDAPRGVSSSAGESQVGRVSVSSASQQSGESNLPPTDDAPAAAGPTDDLDANRAAYATCLAALSREMDAAGIVAGDFGKLDAQHTKMELQASRSHFSDATAACRRALATMDRVEVDEAFVLAKLARFNAAFDAVGSAAGKEVTALAEAIAGAIDAGDYRTANRLLNRGLVATQAAQSRQDADAPRVRK